MVGLLGRTALAVDGRDAGGRREAGVQPGVAGDVGPLLARLGHAAADHLLDERGVDARAGDDLALDVPQRVCGVQAGEPAVALADRRPDRLDEDGVSRSGTAHDGQ